MTRTENIEPKPAPDQYVAEFERLEQTNPGPSWLNSLRKAGISHFADLGFPGPTHEEWQFTNVTPITKRKFRRASKATSLAIESVDQFTFDGLSGPRVVFVDGHYAPQLSQANRAGFRASTIGEALAANDTLPREHLGRYARYDDNPFVALNTAFIEDGAFIVIPEGIVVPDPIHLIYVSTGENDATTHPRNLIIAQKHSGAKVIEHYVSAGEGRSYFTNAVTELVLEEEARLEHCKIQEESPRAFHVATIQICQGRRSHLLTHSISTGALITRNNITALLDASGIECVLNGLYLGRDSQVVDHHTAIHHAKPHCNSHEFYHGILDGRSQGVFNGKIFVRPDAQKTDAKQTNRNLLLSEDASVNTKPQLEIFADDVKCTHGATVGQLNEESIFYLRARGISLERAKRMLIHAFASDIVNRITIEPIRARLDRLLFDLYDS